MCLERTPGVLFVSPPGVCVRIKCAKTWSVSNGLHCSTSARKCFDLLIRKTLETKGRNIWNVPSNALRGQLRNMPTTCQTNRRQTLSNQGYHHWSTGSTTVHNVRTWNLPDRRRNCGTWRLPRHSTLSINSKSNDKFLHDHSWLLPGQSFSKNGRVKSLKCGKIARHMMGLFCGEQL